MRETKKLWIPLITVLLVSMATVSMQPCAGTPVTLLSAPIIKDEGLTPGSTFTIDIAVADVANLWGYLIFLSYDTDVLTATGYSSHPIFPLQEPCEINDTEGYVSIAYHMPFGVPAGFTGSLSNLASIEFTVDALGWSWLDLHDTVFSDPYGIPIEHEDVDGFFANIPVEYGADLVKKSAWPEHHHWDESKDADQTLFGKVKGLGNVPTTAYVKFTLHDGDGLWEGVFTTDPVAIDAEAVVDLTVTITPADLIPITPYGKYYVRAQCWYDDGTGTFVPGAKMKSFSFALVP
jgi:hypothetical protein